MDKATKSAARAQTSRRNLAEKLAIQIKVFQEISRLIGQEDKTEIIIQAALHHLLETLNYHAAQIYRLSPSGKDLWLYLELGSGSKPVTPNVDVFSIDEDNIVSHAIRKDQPIYIPDIHQGPYSYYIVRDKKTEIKSELCLPLRCGQDTLGVLRIQSQRPDDFDQADIDFLSSLTNLLSCSIKTTQTIQNLHDSLQEISILYTLQRREDFGKHFQANRRYANLGYQYDQEKATISGADTPPAAKLTLVQEQASPAIAQDEHTTELITPIKLYGETIGVIGVEDTADNRAAWSTDDIDLLEEISSQVALAIENSRLLQQTQKRSYELSLLFETSRQLSETIDLQQIYHIAAAQIVNYLNAEYCGVALLNKARTHFQTIVKKHRTPGQSGAEIETGSEVPVLESIGDSALLQQILKSPQPITGHFADPAAPFQTLTVFPLLLRNNLVGVLNVGHTQENRDYTPNELQLAQAIISQAAVAVENAQLFEQTQNALAETEKLYELSRALVESTDMDDVFEVVLDGVKAFGIDRVSISLLDKDQGGKIENVTIVASWDKESNRILPVGTKIFSDMFSLVEAFAEPPFAPLISEDLSQPEGQDQRMDEAFRLFMYEGLGAVSMFSTPMFVGPEYKGVLSISTRTPHTYTPQEICIYQTLADQAIIAIERHRLLEGTRRERDRAALLFEFGQKLSQTVTIHDIQETVLSFTARLGAVHGEIFITDEHLGFYTMASTIPERRAMSPEQAEGLVKTNLAKGFKAEALRLGKTILPKKSLKDSWDVDDEIVNNYDWIQAIIATPFYSRRSDLRGVVAFLADAEESFAEDHVSMLESMAIQISATLENIWLLQQTAVALSETELLYKATRDFNSAQNLEDLLVTLVQNLTAPGAQPKMDINHVSIALISALEEDGAPKILNIMACWNEATAGRTPELISPPYPVVTAPNHKIYSADYPFIRRLNSHTPYRIDPDSHKEVAAYLARYMGNARSALCIPLSVGKNWLGMLFVASQAANFNPKLNTINQIITLAGQAAVVIQNLHLVEETQQNLFNSEILSHLSQELLTADTIEVIYNLSLDAVAATEPTRGAAIFMYGQLEGAVELEMAAIWNNPNQEWPPVLPGIRFPAEELGLVPLLKTGQTVVSNNVENDPHFAATLRQLLSFMQIQSLAAVPVWLSKEVNGFVLIGNNEPGTFLPDTVRLYENIGRLISGALENRRLFEEAEYRAAQLQTAAEVSQAATSYLDLDTLLSQAVNLVRDRFGFYHVSIFLVDDYQKYAVVEASTGEIGQKMLAMRHKLAVGGKSIVGTATGTGKPRIALDVGQDAVHFNNPLLPNTRSEMALPLLARGRVIGALDVQSTKRGAFTEGDITILQSMANQLANAIEAAQSYQQAKKALADVSKIQEHYLRAEWSTFLREQKAITGYRLTEQGFVTIQEAGEESGAYRSVIDRAIEAKHPIILPAALAGTGQAPGDAQTSTEPAKLVPGGAPAADTTTLVAPLTLRDQVAIGAVDFELFEESTSEDEDLLRIIETVASQAAQAIESARLFEETQAAREEAEALYQVGRALATAESQQEMLHTVLKAMLSTLGLKQGGILFFEKDRKFGKLYALFVDGRPVPPDLRIPVKGNPSYEKLIETKQPVSIVDFATDPLVAPVRALNPGHKIASLLLVPLIIGDEVVGALGADSVDEKHHFTEREINLAIAMADQLSLILQNRRLLEETRRRAIQLQTSSDVGRVATSILDQDTMLERAVELIKDRFGFYHVQIFLTDETQRLAILHKSTGAAGQKLLNANYKVELGARNPVGQAGYQRRSMVVRDAGTPEPGLTLEHHEYLPEVRAELAIPLQVGNSVIGVLDVHSVSVNDFAREDIASLEALAAQIAIAIQNARAFREQQETAERLKEVDKLKTQFLANMSHELRTPLNSIIGFSRVILKGIDGPLTELQKTDLTSIYNSGQHLLGLINNVLDLSKIEAGKMELNFEEVEIAPIIKGVMSTAMALVKDKTVELKQEIPDNLPRVWADPTRLRQIVLNLVSNACKFTDKGEVTLRVTAEREKIVFSISDTGIGIDLDKLDTIFEEFTQVDASTTRKVGGTGLGLPISRHFVEMHEGQIWVNSVPGRGSVFSFAIPLKPSREKSDLAAGRANGQDGQGKTIMAIDDDPGVINLYRRFLEKRNYHIVGVQHAKNVFEAIKKHTPFAILLDILMPDKDGWNILKELKQDPFTKDIPVIICSIKSDRNRGLALGAVDYLTKPIVEGELINALQNLDTQQKKQVKVLVIDDQADDILLIQRILEAQSYQIFEASNGKTGLDLARSRKPDLVILDLAMPDLDGFAVVEALKKDEQTSTIPIIIVSAKELTPQEHEFLAGQVEVFLRKGIFTDSELLNDVSQALEKNQAHIPTW
ncbi:MAG: GAF domain-containing protein [Chloroflexota bacterium]